MRSYPSWIAGLAHAGPDGTDREAYCARLRSGDRLDLVAEPGNTFDPKAVAIYSRGHHLGYVPARHHWVHDSLSEGDELECVVTDVDCPTPGRAENVHIQISVLVDGDGPPSGASIAPSPTAIGRVRPKHGRRAIIILTVALTLVVAMSIAFLSARPDGNSEGYATEPSSAPSADAVSPAIVVPAADPVPAPRMRPHRRTTRAPLNILPPGAK